MWRWKAEDESDRHSARTLTQREKENEIDINRCYETYTETEKACESPPTSLVNSV